MRHRFCEHSEIARLRALARRIGDLRIALFRAEDDSLHALEDRCPHRGAPLSEGVIFEDYVACRDHGWSICLRDGKTLERQRTTVRVFPVQVQDGQVYIEID